MDLLMCVRVTYFFHAIRLQFNEIKRSKALTILVIRSNLIEMCVFLVRNIENWNVFLYRHSNTSDNDWKRRKKGEARKRAEALFLTHNWSDSWSHSLDVWLNWIEWPDIVHNKSVSFFFAQYPVN